MEETDGEIPCERRGVNGQADPGVALFGVGSPVPALLDQELTERNLHPKPGT